MVERKKERYSDNYHTPPLEKKGRWIQLYPQPQKKRKGKKGIHFPKEKKAD